MSNRKWIFINLLTKETELTYDEAKKTVNDIPDKYLNEAITNYYKGGVHRLKKFIEVIHFIG